MITYHPDLLVEGMNAVFFGSMIEADPAMLPVLCNIIPTTKRTTEMPKLGDVPQLSEWKGKRKITKLSRAKYTVIVRDFEATLEIDRNDVDDDQIGGIMMKVRELGDRAANHPIKLLTEAIENGDTNATYDGVSAFNNSHPARGEQTSTQDNLISYSGSTVANFQTDLGAAKAAMRRFVDEANEPFTQNVSNLLAVVPPELEQTAVQVLFAQTFSTGGENTYQGQADLWVNPRLTATNEWYLFNIGLRIKPFAFMDRQAVQVSTSGFDRSEWQATKSMKYGVDYRAEVGYLLWQLMVKIA